MSAGGIAQRLFDLARVLVGHMTGGLAQFCPMWPSAS